MHKATLLTTLTCCILVGCSSQSPAPLASTNLTAKPETDTISEQPLRLNPADLEKLASWDATSKANAKLTMMMADIMSKMTDPKTAADAIPKLRELAPKFAAVNRAEAAMGEPSTEDRSLVLKNLAAAHKKFDEFFVPIIEDPEIKAIVGQAIDDAYLGNVE